MKNCLLLVLLMACNFVPLKAQFNLVPNPSFENVISCPNGLGQIYLANNWENYGISPDLYCSCSPTGVSVQQIMQVFNMLILETVWLVCLI
ncbi:MAG: hypothetical protein IPP34_16745 [Bacteroidetes bacterium]|nr:hypothetical protein [Bacteroidota bacterium]